MTEGAPNPPGRLYHEALGSPARPALLLIPGLGRQLLDWDDAFCADLTAAGWRVVRLDNRDAGLSPRSEAGKIDLPALLGSMRAGTPAAAPYTLRDMAEDTLGVMDVLDIAAAHVVGTSMGGMVGQTMAVEHPERVRSLVSIMSTTGASDVGQPADRQIAARLWTAPPADREAAVSHSVDSRRMIHGVAPFDRVGVEREERAAYDRAFAPEGTGRQLAAVIASGDRTAELADVRTPTLVIHGTHDPLITPSGGRATAHAVPGARFLGIEGMGHEFRLPPPYREAIVAAIIGHARAAERYV